jgi:Nucleotide modification associated domain 3
VQIEKSRLNSSADRRLTGIGMRIIFSRKGLDSSFGNMPNLILPDGRLCWLPIPEVTSVKVADDPFFLTYHDLHFDEHCIGDLIESISQGHSNPRIRRTSKVHLDPDLSEEYAVRKGTWQPLFGQAGPAECHLRNQDVAKGDLFLFFGWFRQTEYDGSRIKLVPGSNLHLIYGWLQIDERLTLSDAIQKLPSAKFHPHGIGKPYDKNDTIYTATGQLSLGGVATSLAGAGLFPRLCDQLILTDPDQDDSKKFSRCNWRLPHWFYPEEGRRPLSYHRNIEKRWTRDGDSFVKLKAAGRGQEFVLQASDYPEAIDWLTHLFNVASGPE